MKAFVYQDYTKNVFNFKKNIHPLVIVLGIIFAETIIEADKLFEITYKFSPIKNVFVCCAPMTLGEFGEWVIKTFNKKEKDLNDKKQEIQKLNHEIFGLQNPWVKKQPDYMI